jgi:hypothetical protein
MTSPASFPLPQSIRAACRWLAHSVFIHSANLLRGGVCSAEMRTFIAPSQACSIYVLVHWRESCKSAAVVFTQIGVK